MLHEIGHFLLHCNKPRRAYHPRILDLNCENARLAAKVSILRRYFRYIFNCSSGKEREADRWALAAFILFAKHYGARDELMTFLERHPEKFKLFLLVAGGSMYCNAKTHLKKLGYLLISPLRLAGGMA